MHDHIKSQPSILSYRLIIIHNTPQVQMDVNQPINEIPHVTDNLVDQINHKNDEQLFEQHDLHEHVN